MQLLIYDDYYSILFLSVIDNIPDQTVTTGLTVTFNCSAEGSPAISYRWRRTELGSLVERGFEDVDRVSGETTAALTILNVGVYDEGEYTCFVRMWVCMMRGSIPALSVLVALLLGPGLPALPHKVSISGMTTGNNTAN